VFVSLLQSNCSEGAVRVGLAASLADVIAACGRDSEYVHIVFEPSASTRIAFGGRLNLAGLMIASVGPTPVKERHLRT
jgi:hypothetical protein